MKRKDVTPDFHGHKKNNGLFQRFAISLAGGLLGGALAFGGLYLVNNNQTGNTNTTNTSNQTTTQVSNVQYNINSEVTEAVQKMEPAVVSVINLQEQSSNGFDSLFGRTAESAEDQLTKSSEGSGVIYKKEDGKAYVVTNNHVIAGADQVEVMLNSGEKTTAKIIGSDVYSDLAVLQIDDSNVEGVAEFADSDKINVGEPALAMGSPLGTTFANSVSQGIVSAKNRNITNTDDNGETISINAIQTDAAINPGNSGGPLVNVQGQVIGINSSKIAAASSGVSAEGMGFAIPSNDVISIINQLERNGKVVRPVLGISMSNLAAARAYDRDNSLNLDENSPTSGVIIGEVMKGSAAEAAGLKQLDIIIKADGKEVANTSDLQSVLYSKEVGDKLKLTIVRDNKEQAITVHLTKDSAN
ncbi:S1C family serine protease [Vagococcus acidifermentans]|uniref:Serine protease n=1 Tax=Vagococcus acidifermentans TaxID=564710 RepID=A0A430AQZ1_9ENTE|nr:trypsin-like peptidase domain-containing protein [Vagococcus acidifermentans]RSU10403.1 serine protease [Vagococcus acidifermentans]